MVKPRALSSDRVDGLQEEILRAIGNRFEAPGDELVIDNSADWQLRLLEHRHRRAGG
jgi:hypothetical protein